MRERIPHISEILFRKHKKRRMKFGNNPGLRTDIGISFRSKMEANLYRYFQWLKQNDIIKNVVYETKDNNFEFPKKHGTTQYKLDFKITRLDNTVYFVEAKGYMDRKSKTKLKLMEKYYPNIEVQVINKRTYNQIIKKTAGLINYE